MAGKYKRFKKPIFLPNASRMGFDKYMVSIGDFIAWRLEYDKNEGYSDVYYGRVLGEVTHDGMGKKYAKKPRVLAVMVFGERLNHGYVGHVPVDIVQFCHDPGAFTKWALFGEMMSPELTERMAEYGSLSNGHIDKLLDETGLKIVRTPWEKK